MLLTCPSCRSGLQVPDGTGGMVRCPACKTVFSAAGKPSEVEYEEEPKHEEEEKQEQVREPESPGQPTTLLCPTCRSGLQVPAGTTAMIRCPACKTVFSAAQGLAPPEPEESPEVEVEKPKGKKLAQANRDQEEEEEEKPNRKKPPAKKSKQSSPANRDFDPADPDQKPKKRRRKLEEEGMSEEERVALRAAFTRAAWGAKLIYLSIIMFMLSMVSVIAFFFQFAFGPNHSASQNQWAYNNSAFLYLSGMIGLANWILGAVGVGMCLSGPPSKGHWGYGIAAAVAVFLHMLLLLMLIGSSKEVAVHQGFVKGIEPGAVRWKMVATQLDEVTNYLTYLVYHNDQEVAPKSVLGLSLAVGVMEMVRTVLIMMLLSCLAQAAGDEELSRYCTRAAGTASLGPGGLAIVVLLYVMFLIETNSGGLFLTILLALKMGTYAFFAGCMYRAMMGARETIDVCEEPYQTQVT